MSHTALASILGRIPSGIFILTARHKDEESGMLASWVMQAGFEPPMITAAVRKDRHLAHWLAEKAPFVLNVVGEGQSSLLKHFGRGFEPGQSAFDGLELDRCPQGVPILRDALGHLECCVRAHVDSGDHRIFLAEVTGGRYAGDGAPMVHIRKNGLHY